MAEGQAKEFIEQATQSLQGGQAQQALELIEHAIEQDPSSSEAHVLKGIALAQLSQPDAATEAFRRAIMLAPYNVKAYFNLAVHYYALGQKVPAEEMAREALRTDPKHAGARDLLARLEAEKVQPGSSVPTPEMLRQQADQARASLEAKPPPAEPLGATPAGPAQPQTLYTPPASTAPPSPHRPGYESSPSVHSISFVEGLGKNWVIFGYGLALIATVLGVLSIVQLGMAFSEASGDFETFMQSMSASPFGVGGVLQILLDLFTLLLCIGWLVMDIADRRGNWLWLLPFLLCCCCELQGPVLFLYIWKGRE